MSEFKKPFISIGITTYNRKHLLKRCLESLLNQTHGDFEVIVGNDYVSEELSGDLLGINDARIKFVNHQHNLGERKNLNALLELATGEFFTWQFDDDFYATNYVEKIADIAERYPGIQCVFTSFRKVFDGNVPSVRSPGKAFGGYVLSGKQFLRKYLNHKLRAMGLTGAYRLTFLKRIEGVATLSQGPFALYSEYLLLIQAAARGSVGYVNDPLVYYNLHGGSWSNVNTELDLYRDAGINLIEKCLEEFRSASLVQDLNQNTKHLVKLVFHDYAKKFATKPGFQGIRDMSRFFAEDLAKYLAVEKERTLIQRWALVFTRWKWSIFPLIKTKLKRLVPPNILIYLLRIHARFQ